jgi:hypothetical protein
VAEAVEGEYLQVHAAPDALLAVVVVVGGAVELDRVHEHRNWRSQPGPPACIAKLPADARDANAYAIPAGRLNLCGRSLKSCLMAGSAAIDSDFRLDMETGHRAAAEGLRRFSSSHST